MKMSAKPLLSVVIPTCNYDHLLPRALDSVLSQQVADIELTVVDDCSGDNTADVLAGCRARYPHFRGIHQANAGPAAVRNHGIREAGGRCVLLLNANDGALDELRRLVGEHPNRGMVIGAHISVYANGSERICPATPVAAGSPRQLTHCYLLVKRNSFSRRCSLFRRDLMLQWPSPESLCVREDIPVFVSLLVSAPVLSTGKQLARFYKYADSLHHNRENAVEYVLDFIRQLGGRMRLGRFARRMGWT